MTRQMLPSQTAISGEIVNGGRGMVRAVQCRHGPILNNLFSLSEYAYRMDIFRKGTCSIHQSLTQHNCLH